MLHKGYMDIHLYLWYFFISPSLIVVEGVVRIKKLLLRNIISYKYTEDWRHCANKMFRPFAPSEDLYYFWLFSNTLKTDLLKTDYSDNHIKKSYPQLIFLIHWFFWAPYFAKMCLSHWASATNKTFWCSQKPFLSHTDSVQQIICGRKRQKRTTGQNWKLP